MLPLRSEDHAKFPSSPEDLTITISRVDRRDRVLPLVRKSHKRTGGGVAPCKEKAKIVALS